MTSQRHVLHFRLHFRVAIRKRVQWQQLDLDTKKRYLAKTSLIGGVDPYALKQQDLSHAVELLPLLRYISNLLSVYCGVATQHDK